MRKEDAFHELHDPRIEKLIDEFFEGRVDGIEALNMRSAGKMVRDFVQVFYLNLGVPAFFRIEHDVRPLLARAKTHVGLHFDIRQTLGRDAFFEFGSKLFRTPRLTIDILADKTDSTHRLLLALLITNGKSEIQQPWSGHLDLRYPIFTVDYFRQRFFIGFRRQNFGYVFLIGVPGEQLAINAVRLTQIFSDRAIKLQVGSI